MKMNMDNMGISNMVMGMNKMGTNRTKNGTKCPTAVDLELIILYSAGWADHANQGAMMIRRSVGRKMDERQSKERDTL